MQSKSQLRQLPVLPVVAGAGFFLVALWSLSGVSTAIADALGPVLALSVVSILVALFAQLLRDLRIRSLIKVLATFKSAAVANGLDRQGRCWRLVRWPRLTRSGFELVIRPPFGLDDADIDDAIPALRLGWGVHAIVVRADPRNKHVLRLCIATKDLLAESIDYSEMRREHPVPGSGYGVVAIADDGNPCELALFHTLAVGRSGAGKTDALRVLLSLIFDAPPTDLEPLVFAVDPKIAQLSTPQMRSLCDEIATEPNEIADLVARVRAMMMARRGQLDVNHRPVYLVVDELVTALAGGGDRNLAAQIEADLVEITRLGRSLDVTLIATSLVVTKDALGKLRDGFATRIALALPNASDVDLALGSGARSRGAFADKIGVSTPGNAYRFAGTGYIVSEHDEIIRVRFPKIEDSDIERWTQTRYSGQQSVVNGLEGTSP